MRAVFDTFPWPQFAPVPGTPAAGAPEAHGKLAGGASRRNPPAKTDAPQRGAGTVPAEPLRRPSGADAEVDPESGGSRHRLISAEPPALIHTGHLSPADIARIQAVAAAGREVRRIRAEALPKLKGGLRALYRTLELPGANPLKDAHAALDAAVLAAYAFSPKADLLAQLLALNQTVATRIERAEPVTAPGIPPAFPNPETLVTEDCIRPNA